MVLLKKKPSFVLEPRRKFNYTADPKVFYDMIIVGTGVVGLACGMYAGRLGLKVLIVGELGGGTITLTKTVENYPGFISIDGPELGRIMENHAKDYDIDILSSKINRIEIHRKGVRKHFRIDVGTRNSVPSKVGTNVPFSSGKFFSKTLVVATGTEVKKLGVPGEKEFDNKGVSYCALCDGPLFKGKVIGVVGGGNSAVKEAFLLSEYGKKVYIIYRGAAVNAERQNILKLNAKIKEGKIEVITNTNIVEIKGDAAIKSVVFDKEYKGSREFELGGLFVYIGQLPRNQLVKTLGLKFNKKGEIIINRNGETNLRGLYAAGDITDTEWKQAITGVAEGVKAAYYGYQYVSDGKYILPLQKAKKRVVAK